MKTALLMTAGLALAAEYRTLAGGPPERESQPRGYRKVKTLLSPTAKKRRGKNKKAKQSRKKNRK